MSFTISDNGKVIEQSGTDTDLSGLSSISEVVTIDVGSGTSQKTYYNIGSRRLVINGTLTHEPSKEVLIIDDGIANQSIQVNGTYNLGVVTTFDGYGQPDVATGIIITRKTNSNYGNPVFEVTNHGTFNWTGAHIQTAGTVYFREGSTVNIVNGSIVIENDTSGHLIRSFTSSLSVDGLRKIGGGFILYTPPALFNGYVPIHSDLSPQSSSRNDYSLLFYGNSERIDIRDFSGYGNPVEIGYIDNGQARLINPLNGSETTFNGWLGTGNDRSDCYIDIVKEVSLTFKNSTGDSINAKTYVIDDDSGNRKNQNSHDDTPDKIYDVNSTNGSSSLTLTIGIVNVLDGVDSALVDTRFSNNIANLKFINYEYLLSSTNISVKGNGLYDINWILFADKNITETDKTTVDGYSTIDNANQFYDRAKSYLYDNYSGETSSIVSKSGALIDLGDYDLDIDATATSAFSLLGNKITIKSSAFEDSLTTTGIITLLNGATVSGVRTDANGTIAPDVILTLTGLQIGSDVVILKAGTNVVLTSVDQVTETTFSYTYSESQSVDIGVIKQGYVTLYQYGYSLSETNSELPIKQLIDRNYQ